MRIYGFGMIKNNGWVEPGSKWRGSMPAIVSTTSLTGSVIQPMPVLRQAQQPVMVHNNFAIIGDDWYSNLSERPAQHLVAGGTRAAAGRFNRHAEIGIRVQR